MRVIKKSDGRVHFCTCLICNTKFTSNTLESFCTSCFKCNSDIQLKAIKEAGKSYEDFVIDVLNNTRRQWHDDCISHIEITEAENKELYNLYKDRLKNPLPEDQINMVMGIPIKIIK